MTLLSKLKIFLTCFMFDHVFPWFAILFHTATAQTTSQPTTTNSTVPCRFDLGLTLFSVEEKRFAFEPWLHQGQCVRNVTHHSECYVRLNGVLNNYLNPVHQVSYQAASTVLTLIPTMGAIFGRPTPELWALAKMFPPAAFLALLLSFGGSALPSDSQAYIKTLQRQRMQAFRRNAPEFDDNDDANNKKKDNDERNMKALHGKLQRTIDPIKGQNQGKNKPRNCGLPILSKVLLFLGCFSDFIFFAAVMVGIEIVEQGSIFVVFCTGTTWMHIWYIIVTFATIVDCYVRLPFTERWKVYITEYGAVSPSESKPDEGKTSLQKLERTTTPEQFQTVLRKITHQYPKTMDEPALATAHINSHRLLVAISVATDNRISPPWLLTLRLISSAGAFTLYVFATTIFAQVTLLAPPIALMIVALIMAAFFAGRTITSGLVELLVPDRPVMHIICDSNATADKALTQVLKYESSDQSRWHSFEFDGSVWVRGNLVGRRSRWHRIVLGQLAAPYRFPEAKSSHV